MRLSTNRQFKKIELRVSLDVQIIFQVLSDQQLCCADTGIFRNTQLPRQNSQRLQPLQVIQIHLLGIKAWCESVLP